MLFRSFVEFKKFNKFSKDKPKFSPGGRRPSRTPVRDRDAKLSRASRYQMPAGTPIDYKNLPLLQKYLTDRGKILSRRITGISAKQQRKLCIAVKRARFLGLLQAGIRKR